MRWLQFGLGMAVFFIGDENEMFFGERSLELSVPFGTSLRGKVQRAKTGFEPQIPW